MNTHDFWIPTTGEELETLANVLATSTREANDLVKSHAWFGHFFGGHLGKVQANVSVISGKPCLLSDASPKALCIDLHLRSSLLDK